VPRVLESVSESVCRCCYDILRVLQFLAVAYLSVFHAVGYVIEVFVLLHLLIYLITFIDHPQSGVVYDFGRVCLSVCLSDDNFQKP